MISMPLVSGRLKIGYHQVGRLGVDQLDCFVCVEGGEAIVAGALEQPDVCVDQVALIVHDQNFCWCSHRPSGSIDCFARLQSATASAIHRAKKA